MKRLILLALLVLAAVPAQKSPIITADNVQDLHSVLTLDFSDLEAHQLTPASGIFAMNTDASIIVTFANASGESPLSTAVVWDGFTGDILNTIDVGENQYDRMIHQGSLLVATQTGAVQFDLSSGEREEVLNVSAGPVLSVWVTSEGIVCGETTPELGKAEQIVCNDGRPSIPLFAGVNGFARIGRVPPPLAVTVTDTGMVSLWDMTTGSITAQADAGGLAFFGAVNIPTVTHLAWRDPESTTLNLLDFETGKNSIVAALDGTYIAHLRLGREADVILGIDPMSARRQVWAWLPETGERIKLGQYRECERQQPDLALIANDGSALVIGCDLGIDIWRVD